MNPPLTRVHNGVVTRTFGSSSQVTASNVRPQTIVVVGTGYVGSVTAACLAEIGGGASVVRAVDSDESKVDALRRGNVPIHEPGLTALVRSGLARRTLTFSPDLGESIRGADVVFIAVSTPPGPDGEAFLSNVFMVARDIGRHADGPLTVVTKSTVPVGTAELLRDIIDSELRVRGVAFEIDVASNPEFLREGTAIMDFLHPDRIVIGVDSASASAALHRLYRPLVDAGHRIITMDVASAELTKYAANAMLATRISFMNQVASLCDAVGADIECVRGGIGSDPRIGSRFLDAGLGFGGSCFPKDLRALLHTASRFDVAMPIVEAANVVNEIQKHRAVEKLKQVMDLRGARVAVWGISFKPDTDDIRESPSLTVIEDLIREGAIVSVHDPEALQRRANLFPSDVRVASTEFEATQGADALVLVTEWKDYLAVDPMELRGRMSGLVVLDGRNALDRDAWSDAGFLVLSVGRPLLRPRNAGE